MCTMSGVLCVCVCGILQSTKQEAAWCHDICFNQNVKRSVKHDETFLHTFDSKEAKTLAFIQYEDPT